MIVQIKLEQYTLEVRLALKCRKKSSSDKSMLYLDLTVSQVLVITPATLSFLESADSRCLKMMLPCLTTTRLYLDLSQSSPVACLLVSRMKVCNLGAELPVAQAYTPHH